MQKLARREGGASDVRQRCRQCWLSIVRPASASGDAAANREHVADARLEIVLLRVRLDAKRVKRLAEEAPRSGRQHNVHDLLVGQPQGPQPLDVCLLNRSRIISDLFGEIHHGNVHLAQTRVTVV